MDYLISVADALPNVKDVLIKLFQQYPSVRFGVDIVKNASTTHIQADELVLLFLQLDQHLSAVQLVEHLLHNNETTCEMEKQKLHRCFDILKKYAYLADDKVSTSSPSPLFVGFGASLRSGFAIGDRRGRAR